MNQKGSASLILVLLIIVLSFGAFFYLTKSSSLKPINHPQSPPSSSPQSQTLERNARYLLYTLKDDSFEEIASSPDLSANPYYGQTPIFFDEKTANVYLADAQRAFIYNLNNAKETEIYRVSDQSYNISLISVGRSANMLYITLSPKEINMKKDQMYIEELNIVSGISRKIGPQENVIYGNLHYLFKTTKNDDVIASFGGDGCGGYGEIRLISTNGTKLVSKTGGGCVEEPQYVSQIPTENKIILLSTIKGTWQETGPQKLDSFYTKDVYTGEEKIFLDLKPYSDKIVWYVIDQQSNFIYLLFTDEIWKLNLINGQIDEKITLAKNLNIKDQYYSLFRDNKLYYLQQDPITDNFNMQLKVVDAKTGAVKEYDWNKKYPISGQASIFGFWKNQPLVNLYIYPKVNP